MFNIINIIHMAMIISLFIINGYKLDALIYPNEAIPKFPLIWDYRMEQEKVLFSLNEGEKAMIIACLSNQYFDEEILEWEKIIREEGYKIVHSEIKNSVAIFKDLNEAKSWIASQNSKDGDEVREYLFNKVKEDAKNIVIPYRRLILIVEST